MLAWRGANDECWRAAEEWKKLCRTDLSGVLVELDAKERLHLRHTVFRIDSLLCLYNALCKRPHNTELGVLLGAITHLLDFAYDHREYRTPSDGIEQFERIVTHGQSADQADELQLVLTRLAGRAWRMVANPEGLLPRLHEMLETQRRSMAQVGAESVDPGVLASLTGDKGHHSLCLYFAAVNPDFGVDEAAALRQFGSYMQYMDDLEDLYEDRAEGRQSPVRGVFSGICIVTGYFARARRQAMRYYRDSQSSYNYRMFSAWLLVFHAGIVLAVLVRELTRRLPLGVQLQLEREFERLAVRVPFLYVTPMSALHTSTAGKEGLGS